jgi:hypothetical protein
VSKHTPGPWKIRTDGNGKTYVVTSLVYIAQVFISDNSIDAPIDEANARLIAAAPDLLRALSELAVACAEDGSCPYRFMAADALSVVMKAEGQEG